MPNERLDQSVEITFFIKDNGLLTKTVHCGADGSIVIDSSECRMSRGRIERVLLADWRQLAEGISNLPSDTAIAFSTDKCKKGAREADLKDPIGEGQAAILEFVQWWWIDQWDSKLHEDGSLDDLLKGHPIDEIVFEKILSRLEEWTKQKNEQVATRLLSR